MGKPWNRYPVGGRVFVVGEDCIATRIQPVAALRALQEQLDVFFQAEATIKAMKSYDGTGQPLRDEKE